MTLNVVDLFAGIGGMSLGFEMASADFQTTLFCERDAKCQAVLRKHWPQVPIHGDIRTLKGSDLGKVNVLCGGFPCQPYSLAGKRRGKDDDRDLWSENFRIICESGPDWVVGENTSGFITLGLDGAIADLESQGYTVRTFAIPVAGVQAPHIRERVFIVANNYSEQPHRGEPWTEQAGVTEPADDGANVSHTDGAGCSEQRRTITTQAQHTPVERRCRWPVEPGVGRVAHGVSGRVDRIKQLGNAVVPAQVREIADAIHRVEQAREIMEW